MTQLPDDGAFPHHPEIVGWSVPSLSASFFLGSNRTFACNEGKERFLPLVIEVFAFNCSFTCVQLFLQLNKKLSAVQFPERFPRSPNVSR